MAVRRAMATDQRRQIPCALPLWRLLWDEVVVMARRMGRWRVWSVVGTAFVCFLAVEVSLSTATPGPALAEAWRWLVALTLTVLTLCGWTVTHALRRDRARKTADDQPSGPDDGGREGPST